MWDKRTQAGKHVCIFEMERKGHLFTAEIICMLCGVYLSAQQDRPPSTRQGAQRPENQRNLQPSALLTDCEKGEGLRA